MRTIVVSDPPPGDLEALLERRRRSRLWARTRVDDGCEVLSDAVLMGRRRGYRGGVRTVVSDPAPGEFELLMEQRRRWGVDRRDEVWDGVLHVKPLPHGRHAQLHVQLIMLLAPHVRAAGLTLQSDSNLGREGDFRGPDAMIQRSALARLYYPSAALVLEIVSPGDETWEKLPFYAAHGVDEVLIVDPGRRSVEWLGLDGGEYRSVARSGVVDLGARELADSIEWVEAEE